MCIAPFGLLVGAKKYFFGALYKNSDGPVRVLCQYGCLPPELETCRVTGSETLKWIQGIGGGGRRMIGGGGGGEQRT